MKTWGPYKSFTVPWAENKNYCMIKETNRKLLFNNGDLNNILRSPIVKLNTWNTWANPIINVVITVVSPTTFT